MAAGTNFTGLELDVKVVRAGLNAVVGGVAAIIISCLKDDN